MKVVYVHFNDYVHVDHICRMAREQGWHPQYVSTDPALFPKIQSLGLGTILHDSMHAIRGIPHPDFALGELSLWDNPTLERLAIHEAYFNRILDRRDMDGSSFTAMERRYHYYDVMNYWFNVLEKLKPDLVAFVEAPHEGYNYCVYAVAKELGIPVLFYKTVTLSAKNILAKDIFIEDSRVGASYLESLRDPKNLEEPVTFSAPIQTYIDRIRTPQKHVEPFYMVEQYREAAENKVLKEFKRLVGKFQNIFSKGGILPSLKFVVAGIFKRAAHPLENFDTVYKVRGQLYTENKISNYGFKKMRRELEQHTRELGNAYAALSAGTIDLNKKFIFLALHYQPEKTTAPDAGLLSDQILFLDMLSKNLPEDWLIYVKEHPSQLLTSSVTAQVRTVDDYHRMLSYKNVRLVPLEMNSSDLMRNCKAVATATGTVGWEAIVRGIPVLYFGFPWFAHCEGALKAYTRQDLKKSIQLLVDGYKVDSRKVDLFIKAYDREVLPHHHVSIYFEKDNVYGLTYEENMARMSKTWVAAYQNYYGTKGKEGFDAHSRYS